MTFRLVRHPTRDADFGSLLETLLVSACATVLVIRTQLWATNYPQLGGGGIHIAHLLYGGLFMVIAIGLLLILLNRSIRRPAAVLGGVGFGFFIDELGKFITSDNNYFFKPAAALIYLVFVAMYLTIRALERRRGLTQLELLANALDLTAEAARHDLDVREKRRALAMLDQVDPANPMLAPVRTMLVSLNAIEPGPPAWPSRAALRCRDAYLDFAEQPRFNPLVTVVIAVWAVVSMFLTFELVLSIGLHLGGAAHGAVSDDLDQLSVLNWASLASSTTSGVLVVVGLVRLRAGERLDAYRWFERALLVSIFVTRTFSFVESQFGAVFGLSIDLLLLISVGLMTKGERQRESSVLRPADAQLPIGELAR
ncbi:MAG: hypothetical protein JWM60_2390 [Solirubrobacterales bacterium]|nr:hypothetical protein [Solirubrobacterales bacterium]